MRFHLLFLVCATSIVPPPAALAQLAAPSDAGVAMGHIHLSAKDVEATRKMFVAIGGTPVANGTLQMIQFPGVMVMVRQADPTGGSVGSVVHHFGFNVKDIKISSAAWRSAGGTVETIGRADQAWLLTPDGTRIEILEDASIAVPIRMHHIHFDVVAAPEVQAWYSKHFGAKPGTRAGMPAADLPGVNLTYTKFGAANAGTRGRALDHIGFEVRNLPQFIAKLEAAGLKMDEPIRKAPNGNTSIAFITDPWGTRIELTEGLAP